MRVSGVWMHLTQVAGGFKNVKRSPTHPAAALEERYLSYECATFHAAPCQLRGVGVRAVDRRPRTRRLAGHLAGLAPASIAGSTRAAMTCVHVRHVVGLSLGISRHLAPACWTHRIASTVGRRGLPLAATPFRVRRSGGAWPLGPSAQWTARPRSRRPRLSAWSAPHSAACGAARGPQSPATPGRL